jgi:crossover junction endodeoxyribonuclease RuvC
MRILGFDPGLATVGFGVIDIASDRHSLVDFGVIRTSASDSLATRLRTIRDDAERILHEHKPDFVAIEELFFVKNITTGIKVAHARGVLLELLDRSGIEHISLTPLQIKQGVTGYGQATKQQVQIMVARILHLTSAIRSDDAADALAIAICGSHAYNMTLIKSS